VVDILDRLEIRKKHIIIGNKFDCVDGVTLTLSKMNVDQERAISSMFRALTLFVQKYGTHEPDAEMAGHYLSELKIFINTQDSKIRHRSVPEVREIPMCPDAPEFTRRDYESGYVEYNPITRVLKVGGVRVIH